MIQQNETPLQKTQSRWSKKKAFLILAAVLLLLGSFWVQSVADKIQQAAKESLLAKPMQL